MAGTAASRDPAKSEERSLMLWALLGCFVCQMGLGAGYVFGATLKYIVSDFSWSRAAFSAASAPVLLGMGLAAPLVGSLCERFGARMVLAASALLLGASLLALSQMQALWHFFALSALFGVGMTGLGDVVVGSVAAGWVRTQRGLALAAVFVGSNVGGMGVPVLANWVAETAGWRTALVTVGVTASLWILPFALFAVREAPGAGRLRDPEAIADPGPHAAAGDDLDLAEALRTRSFWILAGVLFAFYFYYLAINQHLVAFLSDRGMSDARAAASLSFAVALGIVAKLGIGVLADRIPGRPALFLNFAVLCLGSLLLLFADRPGVLPVFLVAHGFAVAAENVIVPLTVADCFGPRHLARIYGALMLTLAPGGILGPLFAAAIFDWRGDYAVAFWTFAALNLLGLAALAGIRPERRSRPLGAAAGGAFHGAA